MYTPDSPLLGQPQATEAQCSAYMLHRKHSDAYSEIDIADIIVPTYFSVCSIVELDAVLLLSQMIHETGNLTSWWSQRPRRNPAGIGVTGRNTAKGAMTVQEGAWAKRDDGVWAEGVSFGSWAEESIPAHAGRLLAYALPQIKAEDGWITHGTLKQIELIITALRYRALPDRYRGCAPTLRGLQGTWAVPGRLYATKLATIANAICAVQV